jgi:hypothetical protein
MRKYNNPVTVTIGLADSVILPSNPLRVGVIFPSVNANRYTINFGYAVALDQGFNVGTAHDGIEFHDDRWGCMVQREVHAITVVAPAVIQLLEVLRLEGVDSDGVWRWLGTPRQLIERQRGINARANLIAMGM